MSILGNPQQQRQATPKAVTHGHLQQSKPSLPINHLTIGDEELCYFCQKDLDEHAVDFNIELLNYQDLEMLNDQEIKISEYQTSRINMAKSQN